MTGQLETINGDLLEDLGACAGAIRLFERIYGESVMVDFDQPGWIIALLMDHRTRVHVSWVYDVLAPPCYSLADIVWPKASWEYAHMHRVCLDRARLPGADLTAASIREMRGEAIDLSGARLRSASLWGSSLPKANFEGANLTEANLGNCNLQGANLRHAVLNGTLLHGSDLRGADLTGVNVTCLGYPRLDQVIWDDTTRWPHLDLMIDRIRR